MPIMKRKKDVENWIKFIGQNLIDRAKDISNDIDKVRTITIYANITPDEILNFDITKNYIVTLINDDEEV